MSRKNIVKTYIENGFYHLYNRGNNKQNIFFDESDYKYFLFLLKVYLSKPQTISEILLSSCKTFRYLPKNYYKEVTVCAYCLMPNHFHLLVKQNKKKTIAYFMQALMTNYVMYFNCKYQRCGCLFQGSYRAVLLENDIVRILLSKYIHLNPANLQPRQLKINKHWRSYQDYPYSSCLWYLKKIKTDWFSYSLITDLFYNNPALIQKYQTYQKYISEKQYSDEENKRIEGLTLKG